MEPHIGFCTSEDGVRIAYQTYGDHTLPALLYVAPWHASVEERAEVLQGPLFGIHVSSLLFAYASFAVACVVGITYVLLFKEIKAKHLGFFYTRLPSLQVLDRMNQRAIVIGWVFLTVGIIAGVIFAAEARGKQLE